MATHRLRLAKDHFVLPATAQHQHGPSSKQATSFFGVHALLLVLEEAAAVAFPGFAGFSVKVNWDWLWWVFRWGVSQVGESLKSSYFMR